MRRLVRSVLMALLPDDDWSAEFIAALDDEANARAGRRGGAPQRAWASAWYVAQLVRPATLGLIFRLRGRARRPRRAWALRRAGSGLGLDLRHAARSLRRDPRAVAGVGLTLGIGIGSVTALFGVADRLFLSPPPHVADARHVARVYLEVPGPAGPAVTSLVPWATGRALQTRVSGFDGLTLHRHEDALVRAGTTTRPAAVTFTDAAYFEVLGPRMVSGRAYGPAYAAEGAASGVAVVSDRFARERFGSGGAVEGQVIELGGRTLEVVGVAPPEFAGGTLDRIDVWTLLDTEMAGSRNWQATARLVEGRAAAAVRDEAQVVHEGQDPGRFFGWARDGEVLLSGLDRDLEGNRSVERSVAVLLLGVVGLVLVVAWVNSLNLLLARLTRLRPELDVRVALGVGRLRLARQVLLETSLLSLLGGAWALPVAVAISQLVRAVLLPGVAWNASVLRGADLLVAGTLSAATALIMGLLAFPSVARRAPAGILRSRAATATRSALQLQHGLATAQIALSTALLLCAGLFARSFATMKGTELGFDAERVYSVQLRSLDPESWTSHQVDTISLRALDRLRDVDPSTSWALSVGLPFAGGFGMGIHVPGRDSIPTLPGGGPWITMVTDGYFATMGTRILRGRTLTPAARLSGIREVVVGATTAATLWPDADELGGCVRIGAPDSPCWTVVGVAEDVHRSGYREGRSLQIYGPLGVTNAVSGATLIARPGSRGARRTAVSDAARSELLGADPRVDFLEIRRLDTYVAAELRPWRLGATMLSLASGLAVAIALAGVLAVLSYVVAQRRRDFGVRLALGAGRDTIHRLVLRLGLRTGVVGVAIGVGTVLLGARWISPFLFETRVADPTLILVVGAGVLVVSALAGLPPARSATRVDPIEILRADG